MSPRGCNYAAPSIAQRGPNVPRNLGINPGIDLGVGPATDSAIEPEIDLDPPAGQAAQQR